MKGKKFYWAICAVMLFASSAYAAPLDDLFAAIEAGDAAAMRAAIDAGADVGGRSESGDAPLFAAVRNAHFDIAQELVERGADVEASGPVGETAFLIAAGRPGSAEFLKYLDRKGANIRASMDAAGGALECAAAGSDLAAIDVLLNMGLLDESDGGAYSARLVDSCFIAAVRYNPHSAVIKFFVGRGADVNARDFEEGALAWEGWWMEDHPERIEWLMANTDLPIGGK